MNDSVVLQDLLVVKEQVAFAVEHLADGRRVDLQGVRRSALLHNSVEIGDRWSGARHEA
jgi:hypothetical protein